MIDFCFRNIIVGYVVDRNKKTKRGAGEIDFQIGKNLRLMRAALSLSQEDLAQILDVSFQQVQKYEKGTNRLPLASLYCLHRRFRIRMEDFFSGVDEGEDMERQGSVDRYVLKLAQRIGAVDDPALRRKIGKIIDILAA